MTPRTSMAWRLLPLLVVAEVFACLSRGTPWLGEWAWTIDWINGAIIVVGPLLGGLSALDASQVFRRGETPWVASLPRGWLMPFTLIASNWLVGVGIHISALIAGSAANLYVGAEGPVKLQSVPTALLVLAACASIGVLSGALLPNPVTAPLCAAVLFGVTVVGADASSPLRVFRPGGSTGTLVGLTWDGAFLTQAVGALSAITLLCCVLLFARTSPSLPRRALAGIGVAALLGLCAWGSLFIWQPDRLSVSKSETEFVCDKGLITVCLDRRTARSLNSLGESIREAASPLVSAGAPVPRVFTQIVPGQPPRSDGPLFLESDRVNAGSISVDEAIPYVLVPSNCDALTSERPPPIAYYDARLLVSRWILLRLGKLDADMVVTDPNRAWLEGEPQVQERWITETYEFFANCEFDRVSLP